MADAPPTLRLHNTLTREKAPFAPIDPENVRLYVCGPTVYDYAHIGNARPVIVFDVLFRLLRHVYGENRVTYVRNITDVDDKINARALRDFGQEIEAGTLTLNEAIRRVTEKTAEQYHKDVAALGCLPPTFEPRATDNIDGMQTLIATLLQNGHAYAAGGEVLFDTAAFPEYGQLSKRPLDKQQAGARVAIDAHKKNPADFVLWKLSSPEEPGWESPWGRGRPGWHIECSAMSERYLGETFDIHGGGLDLIFPHHENEIAQSRCAHGTPAMANVWMHNGFLQVEGQKMSKSLGNFVTINELLATEKFGGTKWPGQVLRIAMLMTHYREPIDFSVDRLIEATGALNSFVAWAGKGLGEAEPSSEFLEAMNDDLNTVRAIASLHQLAKEARAEAGDLAVAMHPGAMSDAPGAFAASARMRASLELLGIDWRSYDRDWMQNQVGKEQVERQIDRRLAALNARDFALADTIRADLLTHGVQLMDYKDAATGERRTRWEIKR